MNDRTDTTSFAKNAAAREIKSLWKAAAVAVVASMSVACSQQISSPANAGQAAASADVEAPTVGHTSEGVCMRIQRGVNGVVEDARIAQRWADANYGSAAVAFGGSVGQSQRAMLVQFDLSEVPADAKITRATLTLHRLSSGAMKLNVHRATASWSEARVTWTSLGTAFDGRPVATAATSEETDVGPVAIDLTRAVRSWADGSVENAGLVLRQDGQASAFATSEADEIAERPRLEICFSAPAEPAALVASSAF